MERNCKHMAPNGDDNWIVIDGIVYDVSKWTQNRKYFNEAVIHW